MAREKKSEKATSMGFPKREKGGKMRVREIYGKGEEGGAVALRCSGLEWRP